MVMKRVILGCLISVLLATAALATWVPLTSEVSLSSLQGKSLVFGDKELSDIGLFSFSTGGAIAPTADSIFVQGVQDSSANYGLRFLLSGNVGSGQSANATLNFKISILDKPAYKKYFINDVGLYLTGISATGNGVVSVGETVWDSFPSSGNALASLSCSKEYGDKGANLVDHTKFNPLKQIYIQSKDISISGGTNGTAHISELFQYYSQTQIPEPATICLLSLGALGLLRKRRA
jgi:hypothetical protein